MKLLDWFRTGKRKEQPPQEWWERLSRLEHDMSQLELSWEETYGKVRRALAALAKRQEREESGASLSDGDKTGGTRSGASDYAEAHRLGLLGRR